MADKRKTIHISFGDTDEDIYKFLKKQKNASGLLKRLAYNYMIGVSQYSAVGGFLDESKENIDDSSNKLKKKSNNDDANKELAIGLNL